MNISFYASHFQEIESSFARMGENNARVGWSQRKIFLVKFHPSLEIAQCLVDSEHVSFVYRN